MADTETIVAGSAAPHANKQGLKGSRHHHRARQPEGESGQRELQPLLRHQPSYLARLCAERDTYADLAYSLGHRVRHDTVDADRSQHECQCPENDQESAHRGEGGDLRFNHLRHRPDMHRGLVCVDRRDFFANSLHERDGIGGGFNDE